MGKQPSLKLKSGTWDWRLICAFIRSVGREWEGRGECHAEAAFTDDSVTTCPQGSGH